MWEIIIVVLIGCIVVYDFREEVFLREQMYWFVWGLMTLMSGLAYNVGVDIMNAYQPSFEHNLPTLDQLTMQELFSSIDSFEPGYILFTSFFKTIWPSWYFMKTIYAIIVNLFIFKVIKRYTDHWFSVLLFYFILLFPQVHFGFLRQALAMVFVFMAFSMFHKKRWIWGILLILVANLFHRSAIILLVSPLFFLISNSNKHSYIFYLIGLLFFVIFHNNIINWFPNVIESDMYLIDKYTRYTEDEERQRVFSFSLILHYLLNIGVPLFTLWLADRNGRKLNYIPEVYMLCTFLLINLYIPIFARVIPYVEIFQYLILVEFFYLIFAKFKNDAVMRILKLSVILGYLIIVGGRRYNRVVIPSAGIKSYDAYWPYTSVITKKMPPERQYLYYVRIK